MPVMTKPQQPPKHVNDVLSQFATFIVDSGEWVVIKPIPDRVEVELSGDWLDESADIHTALRAAGIEYNGIQMSTGDTAPHKAVVYGLRKKNS